MDEDDGLNADRLIDSMNSRRKFSKRWSSFNN